MDYRERHVVVTGGTGALGQAVVSALIEGGAFCHVPFIHAPEAQRFALREHARVRVPSFRTRPRSSAFTPASRAFGRRSISPAASP